jgi:hypothetical protein
MAGWGLRGQDVVSGMLSGRSRKIVTEDCSSAGVADYYTIESADFNAEWREVCPTGVVQAGGRTIYLPSGPYYNASGNAIKVQNCPPVRMHARRRGGASEIRFER